MTQNARTARAGLGCRFADADAETGDAVAQTEKDRFARRRERARVTKPEERLAAAFALPGDHQLAADHIGAGAAIGRERRGVGATFGGPFDQARRISKLGFRPEIRAGGHEVLRWARRKSHAGDVGATSGLRRIATKAASRHAWTSGPGVLRYCVVIAWADQ